VKKYSHKKRGKVKKKGISPIIAFVLLITLVISLGTFVSIWYKNTSTKQMEIALEQLENTAECSQVRFEIGFDYETCSISVFNAGEEIINNLGIVYSFTDSTKQSEIKELSISPNARKSITQVPNFVKAVFSPILIRGGKEITCTDEREFSLKNPFECCFSDDDCPGELNLCQSYACTPVECINEGHCDLFEICTDNTCGYIKCQNNPDCTYPGMPICDKDKKICIGCTKDAECTDSLFPYCLDNGCVECKDSGNCPVEEPICSNNACVECTIKTDCKNPLLPYCSENTCVECLDAKSCPAEEPICSNNVCVECSINDDCVYDKYKPVCSNNACVACLENNDCPNKGEVCLNNACIIPECLINDDCKPQLCVDYSCVDCVTDVDCTDPLLPHCVISTCVECIVNTECDKLEYCFKNTCTSTK